MTAIPGGAGRRLGLDGRDLRFWGATFGLALLAVALLYLTAFLSAPGNYAFSGFLLDSYDAWTYRVWSNLYARGGWLADNPYAIQARTPAFFNLIWFLVGKLVEFTGLPFLVPYYALGVVGGGLMFLMILAMMRTLFRDRSMAWCAYLLAAFGGGLGWLAHLVRSYLPEAFSTPDMVQLDGYPFDAFWTFPHISLSWFLLIFIYFSLYRAPSAGRKWSVAAGLAGLLMGFSHPYHFVPVVAVVALWYLWLQMKHGARVSRNWVNLLVFLVFVVPGALFYAFLIESSPNFSFWSDQNVVRTMGWPQTLLGFGPFLPLMILGYRGFTPLRRFTDAYLFVVAWALVNFCLLFSYPFIKFEARLIEGLIVPLSVLAVWGLWSAGGSGEGGAVAGRAVTSDILESSMEDRAESGRPSGRPLLWIAVMLLAAMPSRLLVIGDQLRLIRLQGATPLPLSFIHREAANSAVSKTLNARIILHRGEREALDFLAGSSGVSSRDVIMATEDIGLVIPAFAPVRSYLGHLGLTPRYKFKARISDRFFAGGDRERRHILKNEAISLIWWGPEEEAMAMTNGLNLPYLSNIFDNGAVRIYRVNRGELG